MPMDEKRKAALEAYLKGPKAKSEEPPKEEAKMEEDVGDEDTGDESYRPGKFRPDPEEDEPEVEKWGAMDEDPMEKETTDEKPRYEDARERGKRIAMRNRNGLMDAIGAAKKSAGTPFGG